MTDKYFFDTDCLSAFLWVKNENLLIKLYGGRIILPEQVYSELSHPRIPHLKMMTDNLKNNGDISIENIEFDTEEYRIYYKLTRNPDKGFKVIGKGEAAAIALAKTKGGILASNNMRDIQQYVEEYGLEHITTGDILVEALDKKYITEDEGNKIWANMIAKNRKLPNNTFTEFLNGKRG
jgi:predicted nucleic acid-binding protein